SYHAYKKNLPLSKQFVFCFYRLIVDEMTISLTKKSTAMKTLLLLQFYRFCLLVLLIILLAFSGIIITEINFGFHQMPVSFTSAMVISIFLIPAVLLIIGAIQFFRNQIIKLREKIRQNECTPVIVQNECSLVIQ
ncbi:MAG: hypothetical protein KGL19_09405, partial [Bacteroidota bacterium]|nr:hypothetical protein [Bacteroidota bacterium]